MQVHVTGFMVFSYPKIFKIVSAQFSANLLNKMRHILAPPLGPGLRSRRRWIRTFPSERPKF
jgi:hypothetical protein